ncbi:hypothetical protein FBF27_00685 [Candidatus Saccharibacteria bacterium oral taxon 488]|nr:hypothetical protein FBF27_00685 [Candidatus Saccharibacteria bacterium oral taxon 488]
MNPELPQVRPPVESLPPASSGEFRLDGDANQVEAEGRSAERPAVNVANSPMPATVLPTVPVPVPPVVQAPASTTTSTDDTPLIAGDDDLIEKEWVDKLKRIITLTKDDPYERARVIAQLQADYLKKRYNREMGQSNG